MTTVCFMCMILLNSHRIHSFIHDCESLASWPLVRLRTDSAVFCLGFWVPLMQVWVACSWCLGV